MKILGPLAALVGALEAFNAYGDWRANTQHTTAGILLSALVMLASLALIIAGIALFVRGHAAAKPASAAALFAVAVFGGIAAFSPFLSMAASLLGVAFPAIMLLTLFRHVNRTPTAATR